MGEIKGGHSAFFGSGVPACADLQARSRLIPLVVLVVGGCHAGYLPVREGKAE